MGSKLHNITTDQPIYLSRRQLEEITDDFSEDRILGQGGFGKVYKGECQNGKEIAVKVYQGYDYDGVQFKNEISNLVRLEHQNIIRLVGYCYETRHEIVWLNGKQIFAENSCRALCLEYMHNGSLQKQLSDEYDGLEWHTRYKIIKGTCDGLKYLHEGLKEPICHLNLTPTNILLDKNMEPKLADFSLAKIIGQQQTLISHSCIGTIGYVPPEYIERNVVSKMSDIFSLGVVIIKIVTGPTGYIKNDEMPSKEFIDLVHANWKKRLQVHWSGSLLEAHCQQVNLCTEIALNCLEYDRHKRPNIVHIINKMKEMETVIEDLQNDPGLPVDKMDSHCKDMECKDVVLNSGSKNLTFESISEDTIFHIETAGKVLDKLKSMVVYDKPAQLPSELPVASEEVSSPAPVSGSSTVNQNYQDAAKAPSEPQLVSPYKGPDGTTTEAERSSWLGVTSAMEAPMSSSLGAMGPVLRKLDSLLPPEYRLPKPLKDRIELLKDDLEELSVALVEHSMVDSPNEMATYWMNEVRELSYDIEDFINNIMPTRTVADAKMRSVQRYRVGRVNISWLPKTLRPCTRIIEFRTLVREASERHDRYLDGCTSSSRCVFTTGHAQAPALYAVAASYLGGIDDSKTRLIKWLNNNNKEEEQLKVVAIVGPAGVGKTTLAKQVYRELRGEFECRAFVRASRKPDMRRLLGSILFQVQRCPGPSDSCTVQDLIDNLTKHLQDKRYVIVIDDLWETTAWDIVTSAFPEGNNRSRIITTAEIEGVALECCDYQSNNILKMKPLGREDSGKLFFDMVFGLERSCPEQLKEVSDIIITKCAGLPLATICVAGLLASQPDNSELWQHVQEYLCSNLSTNSTVEETLQEILKLSYNSLPHYLKTCLMYLSMYPEGYTMWKVDLAKQWVAECFITATEGQNTQEVAESYFDELVNRGMIQPVEINYSDEVLCCTLHHVVLDLITHKSNEEKFITALNYSQTITGHYSKARRLSFHFNNTRYATKPAGLTLSQVRSLAFFGILKCMPSIVKFKLLRVLVLEFWGDLVGYTSFDLTRICRLFQLRYMKISCDVSVEVELPAQMRRLQYLETLKINARVSAVPLDLPGLLHLSLGDKTNVPDGIGRIRCLHTLEYFDLGKSSEKSVLSLGELINLRDLHLTYSTVNSSELLKRKLAALASSIAKLGNLKSVTLAPGALDTAIYHDCSSSVSSPPVFLQRLELMSPICILSRLPEWIGQLRRLSILKVIVSELLMKDMDMLTGLPALTVLSMYVRQPTAESIVFKRGAFPALRCFKYRCGVLNLAFQEEALPNVQRLELRFNAHRKEQYGHLVTGIEHLPNLKEIAGIIGAAAGAEKPDRKAAESAFKDAIRKDPRFPNYDNVKRVGRVDGEYYLTTQVNKTEEDTNKCADSRISQFSGPGTIFLDRGKSGKGGEAASDTSMASISVPDRVPSPNEDAKSIRKAVQDGETPPKSLRQSKRHNHGVGAMLTTGERDYLVCNSGEQVKIGRIEASIVALYFSASWCPPCRRFTWFTPKLIEAYEELASQGKSFEVVFVSGDQDEEAFNAYFAKMPWLAVPFSDSEGRKGLVERFMVPSIPHLVILNAKTGEVCTEDGVKIASEYGIEAYPFTPERINELKEQEKAAKDNQTILSVLGTPTRDYLVSNKGDKVPISDLEGKYVGLCFVVSGYGPVDQFTTVLANMYGKLKEMGEKFEVVAVSLDNDAAAFNESFASMPWLAIPQGDKMCETLVLYFELSGLPTLVLIGPDGKTLNSNVADIIEEHGSEAWEWFPFSSEKLQLLAEKAKAKAASQTLESFLVAGDLDFVIGKNGAKFPVSELAGKTVLLYFSAKWCGPCRAFLPTLVDVYNKIKEKNSDFEIVFISSDRDQSSFDDFFSGMPWLALPLGDERKAYLTKTFKIRGIPSLVAIGPDGKTVTTDAIAPLAVHGADAFPFTEERLEELEKKIDEMAKGWPEKLKHELHEEHELVLTRRRRPYGCDGCGGEMGNSWSYNCAECDFDLHTECALGEEKNRRGGEWAGC